MQYKITRDGRRPLTFDGELLIEDDSRGVQGPTENRWGEVEIYKTADGHVVAVRWNSQWQGEHTAEDAESCDTVDDVADFLENSQPPSYWGFPLGAQYEAKQNRINATLRHAWAKCVSRVLNQLF